MELERHAVIGNSKGRISSYLRSCEKKTTGFMSVRLAAYIGCATTGLICAKFDIGDFRENL